MAIDDINARPDILQGYKLRIEVTDSRVSIMQLTIIVMYNNSGI